ncbi:MAG: V-type ATP synthase subunit E [Spirochaetales bacterium]|nr:V-type ATP synthase subunit E [Spirochaetales bacterium]
MDVQLKELIETIKTEGVKEAESKSADIIKSADEKSVEIIDKAKKDAAKIISDAKAEAAKLEASGNEALKQAARDLLLNMEGKVKIFFDALVVEETGAAFSGQVLEESIVSILKAYSEKDSADVSILLSEDEYKKLEGSLKKKLADKMKAGLEIKPFSGIDAGFRISEKDGSAYYNFTAQGLAEMLSEFLNPRLAGIMKEAVKE